MALNEKQKKFCEEYLIDLNATQAAIRAGYSSKTATEQASRLLTNVKVKSEIDKAMAERSKRTGINQDRVIQELAKIAFVNAKDIIDFKKGAVLEEALEEDLACIQSVKIKISDGEKGYTEEREIKLNDKLKALDALGKHLGIYKDNGLDDLNISIKIDYGDDEDDSD